jgi:hypothetical protein
VPDKRKKFYCKTKQAKQIDLATLNEDATENDFILQIGELVFGGVSRSIPFRIVVADLKPEP